MRDGIAETLKEFGIYQRMLSEVMMGRNKWIMYKNVTVVDSNLFLEMLENLPPEHYNRIKKEEKVIEL